MLMVYTGQENWNRCLFNNGEACSEIKFCFALLSKEINILIFWDRTGEINMDMVFQSVSD